LINRLLSFRCNLHLIFVLNTVLSLWSIRCQRSVIVLCKIHNKHTCASITLSLSMRQVRLLISCSLLSCFDLIPLGGLWFPLDKVEINFFLIRHHLWFQFFLFDLRCNLHLLEVILLLLTHVLLLNQQLILLDILGFFIDIAYIAWLVAA
jgi:hypothetical protein